MESNPCPRTTSVRSNECDGWDLSSSHSHDTATGKESTNDLSRCVCLCQSVATSPEENHQCVIDTIVETNHVDNSHTNQHPLTETRKQTQSDKHNCFCIKSRCKRPKNMLRYIHTFTPYVFLVLLVSCACALFATNREHLKSLQKFHNATLGSLQVTDYDQILKLKPVTLSEFKRKIRQTTNQYELLRIFFERTDLPEDVVDDLIDAGNFESERKSKPRSNGWKAQKNPDIQVHGDIQLPMHDNDDEQYNLDGIDDVYSYMDELESHPISECRIPQPEIQRVGNSGESGKIYYPECIIVHRCRNVSGCCDDETEYCGPKSIEIFRKPFIALELLKGIENLVQPEKKIVEYRMLINHTACECKKTKKLKGCGKLCPVPFTILKTGLSCKCGCRQNSKRCRNTEMGFESLQVSQLVCIKEGRCRLPTCHSGAFNVREGFCPMVFDSGFIKTRHHPHFRRTTSRQHIPLSIRQTSQRTVIGRTTPKDNEQRPMPSYRPGITTMSRYEIKLTNTTTIGLLNLTKRDQKNHP